MQQPPCHFFAKGQCRNGDQCRFLHPSARSGDKEKDRDRDRERDRDRDRERDRERDRDRERHRPSDRDRDRDRDRHRESRGQKLDLPESNFLAMLLWDNGPNLPSLEAENDMKSILVLGPMEEGRAADLPPLRRNIIAAAAEARRFTLPGAFSLRRQFLRQMTDGCADKFYTAHSMGDAASAKDHADKFELQVREWLNRNKIPYLVEEDLLSRGSTATPDFLILGNVSLNGVPIRWIDAKTYFGSALLCRDRRLPIGKLLDQADRYNKAFARTSEETGAFVFLAGISRDLENELIKVQEHSTPMPLLLSSHPLDTSALYTDL